MKKRLISFALCMAMLVGLAAMVIPAAPIVHAATTSQKNIVDRANYLYNATWVCQKTVSGWRGSYTFYKGNTYRIPYGQPVYAGAYVGFGVSVDDYLAAAADPNSVFYSKQSNYAGKTSTYYATDCSAYVAWSWGVSRQTTATIPSISTYIGATNLTNVNRLQLGDCLNSNSAGHVVLVTGLTYNASGAVTQIEITEQTPPQLKRTYHTPSSLVSKYSVYGIYRYTGTVPAAPNSSGTNTTNFGTKVSAKLKNWVFNADFYKTKYPDLDYMTDNQLYDHYLNYGITEGRQASALFNIKYYLNQNTDLKSVYGTDYEGAFSHFVEFGQYEEGRVYSKQLTAIRDQIFDADFYCTMYPDDTKSFNGDVGRLFANFIKTGLAKGYTASPVFDISYYISANAGLAELYKKDYYGAIHHFISNGQNEIHVVSPILDVAYYTGKYADAAGLTCLAAMEQFLTTLISEVRRGSKNFLAEFYYFTNKNALSGYTKKTCYIHYLLSGRKDGLLAVPYARFTGDPVNLGAGFTAQMTNLKSGLNWGVSGTSVIIKTPGTGDGQKWKFTRQDDGSYEIMNVKHGTLLTTSDNGSAEGVITVAEDVDGTNQRWFIYEVDGYYSLRTACNKWVTIGLTSGSTASGNTIEMANYRANDAQKYTITVLSVDAEECTEHSYLSNVTKAPTCTESGLTTYTCTVCGDSYEETLAAIEHSYETVVTEVTCTENGCTTHTCETCGHSYTENETAALGHDWMDATCTDPKTCGRCGTTEGEALLHSYEAVVTDPTCTDEGYTTYTCALCGDIYAIPGEAATGHHFENGSCTGCGLTDPDNVPENLPTLTGSGFSLSFESEILVNFYYTVSDMTDVAEQGMLVFYNDPGVADISLADDIYTGSTSNGSVCGNTTKGIAAKYMGDSRYYCAYAKLTDGTTVYSKLYQYSPKKYATNMLAKTSTSEGQKALCVAMLNYGAAAQEYFGYKTDDLMNSGLTEEQKALVASYDAALFKGAVAADTAKTANFPKNAEAFLSRSASVSFEGAFAINYYFAPSAAVAGEMTLYYWNPGDYAAAEELTVDNASGSFAMTDSGDGSYWGQLSGIAAKNLDETYYVAGVYTDESGNTCCTGVIAYSLSRYCLNNAKDGNPMQSLAAATAMYGYYAKLYFTA